MTGRARQNKQNQKLFRAGEVSQNKQREVTSINIPSKIHKRTAPQGKTLFFSY